MNVQARGLDSRGRSRPQRAQKSQGSSNLLDPLGLGEEEPEHRHALSVEKKKGAYWSWDQRGKIAGPPLLSLYLQEKPVAPPSNIIVKKNRSEAR